jgi:hypothetical protein
MEGEFGNFVLSMTVTVRTKGVFFSLYARLGSKTEATVEEV